MFIRAVKLTLVVLSVSLTSVITAAEERDLSYYSGLSLGFITYNNDSIRDDAPINTITTKLGAQFDENFALELRIASGAGKGSGDDEGVKTDVEFKQHYGALLKAGFPIAEVLYPYVLVGFTRTDISVSQPSGSPRVDISGTSGGSGFGIDISAHENFAFNFEYFSFIDKAEAQLDGFTWGFIFKF